MHANVILLHRRKRSMLEELVVTKFRLNNLENMTFKMLSLLGTQLSTLNVGPQYCLQGQGIGGIKNLLILWWKNMFQFCKNQLLIYCSYNASIHWNKAEVFQIRFILILGYAVQTRFLLSKPYFNKCYCKIPYNPH